jgi:uncharacterized protein (DUF58 family)
MAKAARDTLLDRDLMNRLERLEILTRRIFRGSMKGERRSKRRGESVEFADYRPYVAGDDLRFLDWNIYARLDRLFLKLFLEEEDLHVSVLIDTSRSMTWGKPVSKGLFAKRLAAALAYIGLCNYDRVSLYAFDTQLRYEMAGIRGKRLAAQMFDFLDALQFDGESNLENTCRHYAIRHPQRGIVILISDFFDKAGYQAGMRYLLGRELDLYCVQVLSPDEIEPTLSGDLRLRDVEDDDMAEVTISRALINRYKQNLQAYCSEFRSYCSARGVSYIFTPTDVEFEQIVLNVLRRRGLLR